MDIRDFIILRLEDMELMSFRMLQTASISTPEWEVGAQLQHTVDGLREILDYHNNWVVALEGPIEIEPISADLRLVERSASSPSNSTECASVRSRRRPP
jgi:Holliday junction resolvasome RuvABC endonuclease subunit